MADSLVGKAIKPLLGKILDVKDKNDKFKPALEKLESTLNRLNPMIEEREKFNRDLDRRREETEKLIKMMEEGVNVVEKCSKAEWWWCCFKAYYLDELQDLNTSIWNFFQEDNQAIVGRDVAEIAVGMRQMIKKVGSNMVTSERIELKGVCSVPRPPAFTIGLDDRVRELKAKLLPQQVGNADRVLTVTGSGGSGKTTLAKILCWDDDVRGKFKNNMFFVTLAKNPKLDNIVHKLFQHAGYQVPGELESEEDTINLLENLLNQLIVKSPILLVLDDVWPGSESLVYKFDLEIPEYKILVTSRVTGTNPHLLKPLGKEDAIVLLKKSASLERRRFEVPDDVVEEIVEGCGGSPLALSLCGTSLKDQALEAWQIMARALSAGDSILDSNKGILDRLQKCFDVLDPKAIECFRDLSLFPEGQRIPASALIDIWTELHGDDDDSAFATIYQLVNWNMADMVVTRKAERGITDYSHHYVMQHNLLRELAIHQTNQVPEAERNRLIIDPSGNNLRKWWRVENVCQINARVLSISNDETFTSEWCNLLPSEVEALVLNLRAKKCTLPMFMKKMSKLKVLVITNYDFFSAEIENLELLDHLSNLKRIRLEKVSIPSLGKTKAMTQLTKLQKLSLFMCNMNEAFQDCAVQASKMLPNLTEINIDYCNTTELPSGLSNILSLKRLTISKCHKLKSLPQGIEKLVNLESLRLSSCTELTELPDSITDLCKLKLLDISECISLGNLPENMGELRNLRKLNVRGCSNLSDLPSSINDLQELRKVICDEETAWLWEPFKTTLAGLKLVVVPAETNLNWLF